MRRSYMNRDHVSTYDYDARGMLQHISHHTPDTSLINYFEYHYDRAGRRTSMATRDNDALYTYDDLDRLTGADYSNFWKVGSTTSQTKLPDLAFVYDTNGNRRWTGAESSAPFDNYDDTNRLYDDGTYTHGVLKHIFGGEH